MGRIKDLWNKKRFSIYDSEEKTALKLFENLNNFVGDEIVNELDNKTDITGNHLGSWQGLNRPTLSEEGMRATVEKLDNIYNTILTDVNDNLNNIDNELSNVKNDIDNELSNVKNDINIINDTSLNIMKMQGTTKEQKFINALTYAHNNNYKKIFVPSGEYNFKNITNDTIILPLSHYQVIIEGENTRGVVFNYSESHINKPFLKVQGYSGTISQAYIKNITFYGNDTSTAIELNNTCGYRVENCNFENNKIGILFHNTDDGFTELCVADYCNFATPCITSVKYQKDGTQTSFHGSGLQNCYINQNDNSTSILIDNGCFPYNAPLDFRAWTRGTNPLIENSGSNVANFYGNISIESFNPGEVQLVHPTGFPLYLNGTLSSNSEKIKALNLILCDRIQLNSDYSINTMQKPKSNGKYCTSSTPLIELKDCETFLVDVHLTGDNYEVQHTLIASSSLNNNGNGNVTIISKNREHNEANLGLPSYRLQGNILFIENTNFNGSNVVVQYTFTQLGGRTQYHII